MRNGVIMYNHEWLLSRIKATTVGTVWPANIVIVIIVGSCNIQVILPFMCNPQFCIYYVYILSTAAYLNIHSWSAHLLITPDFLHFVYLSNVHCRFFSPVLITNVNMYL